MVVLVEMMVKKDDGLIW